MQLLGDFDNTARMSDSKTPDNEGGEALGAGLAPPGGVAVGFAPPFERGFRDNRTPVD